MPHGLEQVRGHGDVLGDRLRRRLPRAPDRGQRGQVPDRVRRALAHAPRARRRRRAGRAPRARARSAPGAGRAGAARRSRRRRSRTPRPLTRSPRRCARSPARAAASSRSRSHSTVPAIPSRRSTCASQPSSRFAFSTEGQRRCTSTSNEGRCSSSNASGSSPARLPDDARDLGHRALLGGRHVEVLVLAAGWAIAVTIPAAMSSTCVRVRVCSPEPKIGSGPRAGQHLADHVGDHVRDARLVVGQLARPVGVERAADRVRQAVLVVQGAAVDLAGELREAVGRARRGAVEQVLLGGRELASRARTPSTRRRTRAARPAASSAARKTAL